MPSWVESSLAEAASALSRSGESELAAILDRLRQEPEVQALQLYRSVEVAAIADELYDCDELPTYFKLLGRIAAAFDVRHCTVHCVRERSTAFYDTKVLTTFPKDWVADYVDRRYSTIDPVIARCRRAPGLFFWEELSAGDPITKTFTKTCIAAGIGPSGVTFTDQASNGGTIGVTLCSTLSHAAFRKAFATRLDDFTELARIMIEVFSDLACEKNEATFNATDDQLKVLRALASGRSLSEVETFHFSYGSFRTIEKSILRSFGAKTLAQATAVAANMGLLEDLPYFEGDILAGVEEPEMALA